MNAILQAFGRLVCGVTGRHKWGRKYYNNPAWNKVCRRCGERREVQTRGKK